MAGNNLRYQNPYLPSSGKYDELAVPIADWQYPGQIGSVSTVLVKDADGVTRSKSFMIVKTASVLATATVNGSCLWWSDQDLHTVTTLATNRGRVAGIAIAVYEVSQVVAIQIGGRHPGVHLVAAPTTAATAAGNPIVPSATAAKVDALPLSGVGAPYFPVPLGHSVGAQTGDFAPVYLTLAGGY